ncbi:MAG: hypothetical protein FWF06_02025, partial [Symbiobacteriaceae bacterium]|nr:hypothetical protein [Symbiobacteriaceae bacterium]
IIMQYYRRYAYVIGVAAPQAKVVYEESTSVLKAHFDDSVEVVGTLKPMLTASGSAAAQLRDGQSYLEPRLQLVSASNLPPLPTLPSIPNLATYFNEAVGTAKEQVTAYRKALESQIAAYQNAVESQINSVSNMAQDQINSYRNLAKQQLESYKQQGIDALDGLAASVRQEVEKYKKMLTEELSKYIDLGMLGSGLIEFDAATLTFGMLDALQGVGVDTAIRCGYDMRNQRCYYAIAVASTGAEAIDLIILKVRNFAGLFIHNMEPPKDIKTANSFPRTMDGPSGLKEYLKTIPVHRGDGGTTGIGIIGDLIIGEAVELRDTFLYITSGPIISANGELWVKSNLKSFRLVAKASLCYSHPERYFALSATINKIPFLIFDVSGSIGLEVGLRPTLFGLYVGYPDTLKLGKILGVAELGVGFCFRIADGDDFVAIKVEAGTDINIDVAIVYARGYLKFGAEGKYIFRSGTDYLELVLWLKGGITGGIRAFDAEWNIIGFYADAKGVLSRGKIDDPSDGGLHAKADIKVSYHLNLLLGKVSGSISYHFKHDF